MPCHTQAFPGWSFLLLSSLYQVNMNLSVGIAELSSLQSSLTEQEIDAQTSQLQQQVYVYLMPRFVID